jgi:5-methylthioadenosine/S-adenosylhomocysteine deaminase
LIHKWNEKNPQAADAQTILDLATFNGAKALKMKKEIGSLTIGKKADMVIVNFDQPHLKPHHNTVSHLVYSARGADVETVMVGGRVLLKK